MSKINKIVFLLLPLLLTSCGGGQKSGSQGGDTSGNPGGSSGGNNSSIEPVEDEDEYDHWLDSWSQPVYRKRL